MKLSVVIPSYNTADILEKSLKNLIDLGEQGEIIVVDNASSDNTSQMVKDKFPQVKLIETQNNGLAWACNRGIEASNGDYICFLGSDAFPEKGTLVKLVDYLDNHPDVGAITPKLVLENGQLDMDAHRFLPTPWNSFCRLFTFGLLTKIRLFDLYYKSWLVDTGPHEIGLCIMHFLMVRRSVFEKIGMLDETFFLYGEDVDLCYRITSAGYKLIYHPDVKALHLKGYGVGVRSTTRDLVKKPLSHRLKMRRLSVEAMDIFVKKHYKTMYPKPLVRFMQLGMFVLGRLRILIEYLHR